MQCYRHPDREAVGFCQRQNRHLCEECQKCQVPKLHCKFRDGCIVYFIWKEAEKEKAEMGEAELDC